MVYLLLMMLNVCFNSFYDIFCEFVRQKMKVPIKNVAY